MQSAKAVLDVLRERGRRGLPLEELYRQMFNPQLYLLAYGRIYANKGAMTPGATQETVDGMSIGKIGRIIDALRHERYRFSPVRRVYIPKKSGKLRPLGLPTWSDKLVAEVVRLLLEAYYEPTFSDRSHGFRPGRGCHTALREVAHTWTGTSWFVEGDLADCFGSFDHSVMLQILGEDIHDNRFLRLVRNMCQAGYLEDWAWGATLSGVPQGASPLPSFPTSTCTSWTFSSRQFSYRSTPEAGSGLATPSTARWNERSGKPVDGATVLRCGPSTSGCTASPARTLMILVTGGCAIAVTPTTPCSALPGQ